MDNWLNNAKAIVEAWYPGMMGGKAIVNILFGDINPSGKLPLTFPRKLSDSPAHKSNRTFPGNKEVFYDEGIFLGYRFYDHEKIEPLFPFGYGLSYTSFEYSDLALNDNQFTGNEKITGELRLKNIGDLTGKEVIQIYVQDLESSIIRPQKELKGFTKELLNPGESKTIHFELDVEDLKFYDEEIHDWKVESGNFKILVGSSAKDIHLESEFYYTA